MVSIIIPYYNRPIKLQRTLDSVFKQTYQDFEVIVVDDCSEEKLNINDNNTIRYVCNSENRGPGFSRQVGLQIARGSYVCFLDSDDYWHEQFLEHCVKKMESLQYQVAFVYVITIHVKNGKVVGVAKRSTRIEETILPNILVKGRTWDTGACLWDKAVLDKADNWITSRNWEDYAFDISAALINNHVIAIEQPLLYVETGGKNKLSGQDATIIETEKSKALGYISNTLKNSIYYSDGLIKRRVAIHLINNTIALMDLSIKQTSFVKSNIKHLRDWKSHFFVSYIYLLTIVQFKYSLSLLRRVRKTLQKKDIA